MAQQNIDYGELFCAAVDTIVQERLTHVSYDRTILCTIVDDTERAQGLYTVTENDSTKFIAYSSDTSYRNGQNVYVQIPGGDWNQQKIIVAKKSDNTIEPYVYQKPFSSLVDITGNVISNSLKVNGTGLIANACTEGLDTNNDPLQSVTLWSYNSEDADALIEDRGNGLSGYTRLGIQASFQSWLNPFYINVEGNQAESSIARIINQGEYGLRLRVRSAGEAISKDDDNKDNISVYDLYLNQEDMNGNPYDFETYFTQEKVFDITALGNIVQMELQFYQIPRTFKDNDGNEIPYKNFLGQLIKPNLYVKDVYISLGYDVSQFDEEMIQIYTLDSTTYSRTANPLSNNHKEIQLRWIQKQADGSFKSITEKDNLDYELRWYRYKLGASSADPYSGVYWSSLSTQKKENEMWQYTINDSEWDLYNKTSAPEDWRKPGFFSTWLLPDTTLQDEQVKAILLYNGKVYRSNVLYCTNEDEVVSKPTVDAVQALSVNCDDDTFGNYRIYNLGNMLIDYAQGQKVRTWTPYFKSSLDAADAAPKILTEAESIEWIIPVEKTMIVLDEDFKSGGTIDAEGRIHIVRMGSGEKGTDVSQVNTQKYRIRSYYSQNYSNNTIQCKIVKDKITYTATKELTFGPAGTTGTDATFVLDFDNGVTAVTLGADSPETVVTARLYDYENNEVDISSYNISWGWKNPLSIELITQQEYSPDGVAKIGYKRELKPASGASINNIKNNFHILQATLTGWGDYDLIAYLPIPIRTSKEYSHIAGTTQILYESSGEILDYFKNPYAIFDMQGNAISGVSWAGDKVVSNGTSSYTYIHNGTAGEEKYTPQIYYSQKENNYSLQPLTIYVEDASNYLAVHAKKNGQIIWSQPILVLQNRYPAAMVNKWDGALKVDEKNNAILAAKFVAGRKESNNTFTGVMMGDWGTENAEQSIINNTGIFGFHQGEQSFGFKDDGTAFIGKSNTGRIEFDGSEGVIESAVYDSGQGMSINLRDGTISAHEFTLSAGSGDESITISTLASNYPLSIGLNFDVEWNGTLHAKNGQFSGHIDAIDGTLGDLEVTGNITVKTGSIIGDNWSIKPGIATFDNIIANSTGTIGGWTIDKTVLSSSNLLLNGEDGMIYSTNKNFSVNGSGTGFIGGCTIDLGSISANYNGTTNGWIIGSDGSAVFNNVTVRGAVYATSGEFTGTIKAGSSITCGTGSPPAFQVTAAGVMTAYSAQLYDLTVYKSLTVAKGTGNGDFSVAGASTLTGDTTIGGKLKINAGTLNRSEQLIIGGTSYLGGSTYVKGNIIMDAGSRGNIRSSAGDNNYISFGASDSGHGGGVWIYGEITSLKASRVDIGSGDAATTNFYGKVVTDGKETKTTKFSIGNASLDFSRGFLVGVSGADTQGNISVQVLPECSANDSGKVLTATGKNTYAWSYLKKKFNITLQDTITVNASNFVTEYTSTLYDDYDDNGYYLHVGYREGQGLDWDTSYYTKTPNSLKDCDDVAYFYIPDITLSECTTSLYTIKNTTKNILVTMHVNQHEVTLSGNSAMDGTITIDKPDGVSTTTVYQ